MKPTPAPDEDRPQPVAPEPVAWTLPAELAAASTTVEPLPPAGPVPAPPRRKRPAGMPTAVARAMDRRQRMKALLRASAAPQIDGAEPFAAPPQKRIKPSPNPVATGSSMAARVPPTVAPPRPSRRQLAHALVNGSLLLAALAIAGAWWGRPWNLPRLDRRLIAVASPSSTSRVGPLGAVARPGPRLVPAPGAALDPLESSPPPSIGTAFPARPPGTASPETPSDQAVPPLRSGSILPITVAVARTGAALAARALAAAAQPARAVTTEARIRTERCSALLARESLGDASVSRLSLRHACQ